MIKKKSKLLVFILLFSFLSGNTLVFASDIAVHTSADRMTSLMPKAVELYSWRVSNESEWHFVLLRGTNRMKTVDEIFNPEHTIVGVSSLKEKLKLLAEGETIYWIHEGPTPHEAKGRLSFPNSEIIGRLKEYSTSVGIKLMDLSSFDDEGRPR